MNADLISVGAWLSDKEAPFLSALFRKPTMTIHELWERDSRQNLSNPSAFAYVPFHVHCRGHAAGLSRPLY